MTLLLLIACSEYRFEDEPKPTHPDIAVLLADPGDGVCPDTLVSVDLLNEGDATLTVLDLAVEGGAWALEAEELPLEIAPGRTHTAVLRGDGGEGALLVTSDDADEPVTEVTIAATENASPAARVVSPAEEAVIPADGDLTFVAFVGDDDDALDALAVEWTSSLVGGLGTSTPDADGRVELVWAEADRLPGPQFVSLTVTDPCGAQAQGLAWYCQDGPYEVYPIVEEAWHYEGAARMDDVTLTLTEATADTVGAAFDLSSLFDGDDVELAFEFQIEGGTGGEGLSVTLLDADRREGFVGGDGCGLGFGGGAACTSGPALPGWSLAIDTHPDEGDCLDGPHVAFAVDGDVGAPGPCAAIPAVDDGAWHTLALRLVEGTLTVTLDGAVVLEDAAPGDLDFQGYIGFTASTTDATNAHRVRAVRVVDFQCV